MRKLASIASLLLISAMLTACGGGGGSSASAQPEAVSPSPVADDPSTDPAIDRPAGAAQAVVAWTAPVAREDGSTFLPEEIAGYEVYHIEGSSGEMEIIEVDADVTEYQLPLASGTHELGIAVVDVDGVKSHMSELQTVEIN